MIGEGLTGNATLGAGDDDLMVGEGLHSTVYGNQADDAILVEIRTGSDELEIFGGQGNDEITVSGSGDVVIHGNKGDDVIQEYSDDAVIYRNEGDDMISGASGNDTVFGGQGYDTLIATNNATDVLSGNMGADIFHLEVDVNGEVDGFDAGIDVTITDLGTKDTIIFADQDSGDTITLSVAELTAAGDLVITEVGDDVYLIFMNGSVAMNTVVLKDIADGNIDDWQDLVDDRDYNIEFV